MDTKLTLKIVAFWTIVAIVPGGSLLLAFKLGKNHTKIREFFSKQLSKLKETE